ncbi:hypothetical protein ABE236_12275 [Priestia endophytica]|uniref:hypothetical protein n=1 Tax=Priestia endophytica TaxID=135735 RepID=UPI003D2E2FA3
MNYLQVESEDIKNLDDFELTKLLSLLLYNEADKFNLVKNSVSVALNITVADGGEDGHIKWENDIEKTDWIPSRYTLFQVKATDMAPGTCKKEVLTPENSLKPRVEDVIKAKGTYILFHNRELNEQQIQTRIAAFEESISSVISEAKPNIEIYDASKIAEWCNNYLAVVCAVWGWNGKHILAGSKTYEDWNGHKEFQSEFISTYETEQIISDLGKYFESEKKVARIIGLPGKGKTRLALQVFRNSSDIGPKSLRKRVIYIDATYSKESIISSVTSWRHLNMSGIIVVDNCDYELHKALKSEVEHTESNLSLLTIDFNLHESISSDPLINLEDVPAEIIEGIIKNSYPEMDKQDLERIVTFADGFPSIATLLAEARINDFNSIGSIQDSTLVNKLLWGRDNIDEKALKVIESCAVFENLGFEDEKEFETKYVAENICGITLDEFYEKCQYFIKKKIIVKHGRYIKLVPKTLAITLAAQWWEKCRPQKAQEVLSDSNLPSSMIEQLCNQISKLHFLEKAQELTVKLCGIQAPFGQAEILSSEVGSRIFCSFVEIDPMITVETLDREFGQMSISDLRDVKEGRRNLVRSLEKLCFWENTFEEAAKILGRFAAAENEHWANNATGQFLQLFHYTLSGTQAHLINRVAIIDWALSFGENELKKLAIEAAGHALMTQGFSRMIGVESQGSRPSQQEWRPENWGEIFDYWDQVLSLLTELIIKDDEFSELISEQIVGNVSGLIKSGYVSNMDKILKPIFNKRNNFWPEFLDKLNVILKFDESKMPEKISGIIKSWRKQLMPQDITSQIRLLVCNANSDYIEDENRGNGSKYRDAALDRINDFLDYLYPKNIKQLKNNIHTLLIGEQKQTFYFAKELFDRMNYEEKIEFLKLVDKEIQLLAGSEKVFSFNLLGGILYSLQSSYPELLKNFLDKLDLKSYSYILAEIIRYIEVDERILNRLLHYVEKEIISIESLLSLAYGPALNNISENDLISFLEKLFRLQEGKNQIIIWKIYYRYYLNNRRITSKSSSFIISFLEESSTLFLEKVASYEVEDLLVQLYNFEEVNKEHLTKKLINNFFKVLEQKETYTVDSNISEYLDTIIKYDSVKGWELISKKLLECEGLFKYRLVEIMGHTMSNKHSAPVHNVPIETLKHWAITNKKASQILAELYPVNVEVENKENSLIHFLITEFGTDEIVLRSIDRQLRNFSWWGSPIPYYKNLISFYKFYSGSYTHIGKWANKNIRYLEAEIKREKIREDEEKLRF